MHCRVKDCNKLYSELPERYWESRPERVKAPYGKTKRDEQYPKYHETRETLWEVGGTTWRVVPPASHKVSRVSWYSGSCQPLINFAYGIFTLSDQISQNCSAIDSSTLCSPQPRGARTTVWALSISLAATLEIEVSFFSSGYLDVSVPPVPFHTLWIGVWILEVCSSGFPHSDISGSMDICSSPKLFAAYHVLHRLSVPRHPPCALNA